MEKRVLDGIDETFIGCNKLILFPKTKGQIQRIVHGALVSNRKIVSIIQQYG